ncbi:hypothetical protein EYF80_009527 [Liparis tanakae]|uniref:Uncharacterized protein n=1 Tax=Liparis tanakae TaxID=230148 RepID=A0A4Z2ISF0_9TELE|nr:hypothetical protein EYF80_009527 [Liparis tanakae]
MAVAGEQSRAQKSPSSASDPGDRRNHIISAVTQSHCQGVAGRARSGSGVMPETQKYLRRLVGAPRLEPSTNSNKCTEFLCMLKGPRKAAYHGDQSRGRGINTVIHFCTFKRKPDPRASTIGAGHLRVPEGQTMYQVAALFVDLGHFHVGQQQQAAFFFPLCTVDEQRRMLGRKQRGETCRYQRYQQRLCGLKVHKGKLNLSEGTSGASCIPQRLWSPMNRHPLGI